MNVKFIYIKQRESRTSEDKITTGKSSARCWTTEKQYNQKRTTKLRLNARKARPSLGLRRMRTFLLARVFGTRDCPSSNQLRPTVAASHRPVCNHRTSQVHSCITSLRRHLDSIEILQPFGAEFNGIQFVQFYLMLVFSAASVLRTDSGAAWSWHAADGHFLGD